MKGKLFCIWMCIAMIVTLMPSAAFANEINATATEQMGNEIMQATNTNNAMAGSIALVSRDENDQKKYDTDSTFTMQVRPGQELVSFCIGTGEGENFVPLGTAPESCIISVKKDTWEEAVQKTNPNWQEPLYEKAFIGYYGVVGNTIELGYNQNAILQGEETYGDYDVTVVWSIAGKTYAAETVLTMTKAKTNQLLGNYFSSDVSDYNQKNGFLKSLNVNEEFIKEVGENRYQLKYAPYYDYSEENKETMIYVSSHYGILNYVGTDCQVEGVFTAGDEVEYKNGLKIVELEIDYSKITSEMLDQTYNLNFKSLSGETVVCEVSFKQSNDLDFLQDGELYAIEWSVVEKKGRLYLYNQSEDIDFSDSIRRQIVGTIKEGYHRHNFGIWDAEEQNFWPADVHSDNTAVQLRKSSNIGEGYLVYAESVVNGELSTTEGKTIAYTFSLPEVGLYSTSQRSDKTYLEKFSFLNAAEKNDTRTESYFYLITPTYGYTEAQMQISLMTTNWKYNATFQTYYQESEEEITGITDKNPETKVFDGQEYALWKIGVSIDYRNRYNGYRKILIKFGDTKKVTWGIDICDSTEIPSEQQLYWIRTGEPKVAADGTLTNVNYSQKGLRSGNHTGEEEGYLAVKKGDQFYAVNSAFCEQENVNFLLQGENYVYKMKWSAFGAHLIRAYYDGKEYYGWVNIEGSLGDIDANYKVDFADALWLKRYLADWDYYRNIGRQEADLDWNGKITASDLMILERHIAGWAGYESLPYCR